MHAKDAAACGAPWPRAGGYARALRQMFGHLFHSVLAAILETERHSDDLSSRGVNIFKAEDSCPCRLQRRRRLCTKSAGQLAMEKTVASPPWKTLRLSHFSPATTAAVHPYPKIRRETCSETKGLHKGYDVNSLTRTGTKSRSGQV